MDTLALREMDQKADRTIANWTAVGLVANLLPPPFDYAATAGVFARLGLRLADIYEVETTWETARGIGLAMLAGFGSVAGAFYVATGWMKWIPGANLWAGLLVQPPVVAAIAFAVGHGFKEYFRAQRDGRVLTSDQIAELATAALREKLEQAKGALNISKQEVLQKPHDILSFLALPYSERQLIRLSSGEASTRSLKHHGKELVAIPRDVADQLSFPPGHPRQRLLYAGHPTAPTIYYPAAQFHIATFEHKFWEAVRLLSALGATHIRVEYETGWSVELATKLTMPLDIKALRGEFTARNDSSAGTQVLFEANLPDNQMRELPDDLRWLSSEEQWRTIRDLRRESDLKEFVLLLKYQDNFGIDGALSAAARRAQLEIGGQFKEYQATVWRMVCQFA